MADKNHKFAIKMLHYHGFITRSDITSRFVGWDKIDDIGRADIFAAKRGLAFNIEVKQGKDRFQFDSWRDPQRKWSDWSSSEPFCVPYYLFLTLGANPANYNIEKYTPKKSWLLTIEAFKEVEDLISPYQKSVPYKAQKGMNKIIQKEKLDAISLWAKWELKWAKNGSLHKPSWDLEHAGQAYGGFWVMPANHPLYQTLKIE